MSQKLHEVKMFAIFIVKSVAGCDHQLVQARFFKTEEDAQPALRSKSIEFPTSVFKVIRLTPAICKRYRADRNARFPELLNKDVI